MNKDSTDAIIAGVLLEKLDFFPEITIEEIAYYACTTAPIVTKFLKKIGYRSFREIRYDLTPYSGTHKIIEDLDHSSLCQYFDSFHQLEQENDAQLLQHLNMEEIEELARAVYNAERIVILQVSYNHNIISLMSELLIRHGRQVVSINRGSQDSFILENVKKCDIVILTSLTGSYIEEHYSLMKKIRVPVYVISGKKIEGYPCICAEGYEDLFNTYYHS